VKLAPRKPDWDLKRDVAKKLEKLERRTQRAIAELIRMLILSFFIHQHWTSSTDVIDTNNILSY